jgi:hypothetical protein
MASRDPASRRKQGVVAALAIAAALVVGRGRRARAGRVRGVGASSRRSRDAARLRGAMAARSGLMLLAGIHVAASRGLHSDAIALAKCHG